MNNEEEFKSRVKDLLDGRQFSYDASNWEEASRVLDQREKRKKRFLFILFCGLGLCLSGFLIFTVIGPDISTKNSGKELTIIKNLSNTKITNLPNKKQYENSVSKRNYNYSTADSIKGIHAYMQLNQRKKQKSEGKIYTNQKADIGANNKYTGGTNMSAMASITGRKNKKSTNENNNGSQNAEAKLFRGKIQELKKETNIGFPTEEKTENYNLHAAPIENSEKVENATIEKTGIKSPSTLPMDSIKNEIMNLQASKKDTVIDQLVETPVKDTITTSVPQPTLQNTQKTSYFYVEAGTYVNFGWKYQNVREAASLNPYVGASYFTKLSEKLGFSIGVYYTSLSNLKTDTKVIKSSKIVFGEESDVTVITPITVNYLLIPAKFQYNIDSRQSLTVGYNLGYLFDVRSKVDTYTERVGTQENRTSTKLYGYTDGFKSFNSQLTFGYRRFLYKNLWLNGEIIYGLTDLRDNTFFGINFNERMTGLKISLTYDLLKK